MCLASWFLLVFFLICPVLVLAFEGSNSRRLSCEADSVPAVAVIEARESTVNNHLVAAALPLRGRAGEVDARGGTIHFSICPGWRDGIAEGNPHPLSISPISPEQPGAIHLSPHGVTGELSPALIAHETKGKGVSSDGGGAIQFLVSLPPLDVKDLGNCFDDCMFGMLFIGSLGLFAALAGGGYWVYGVARRVSRRIVVWWREIRTSRDLKRLCICGHPKVDHIPQDSDLLWCGEIGCRCGKFLDARENKNAPPVPRFGPATRRHW